MAFCLNQSDTVVRFLIFLCPSFPIKSALSSFNQGRWGLSSCLVGKPWRFTDPSQLPHRPQTCLAWFDVVCMRSSTFVSGCVTCTQLFVLVSMVFVWCKRSWLAHILRGFMSSHAFLMLSHSMHPFYCFNFFQCFQSSRIFPNVLLAPIPSNRYQLLQKNGYQ
jgi:hypothetical protein